MKITTTSTIFVFLAVIASVIATPTAFADHMTATVSIPAGSGASADAPCVAENTCYIPSEVTIDIGGEVTWTNDDTAAHTVTSGTAESGPAGVIVGEQNLLLAGNTLSHKFDAAGEYPYFCMVHPWMVGKVIVQEAMAEEPEDDGMMEGMTELYGMSSDGTVKVEIETTTPTAGEAMTINVEFTDAATGSVIEHINYDITATQAGTSVLETMAAHEHMGDVSHTTATLSSGDPVDVTITLQGIGLPGDEANWTGPMGDVVMFTVVPEFGTIAVMILGIAIVSIIAMTTRSKIIPRI
ncbi:MAG: plastocyanin/azurin family copper-binding protein [Nitrosopumilaceae archaeon]